MNPINATTVRVGSAVTDCSPPSSCNRSATMALSLLVAIVQFLVHPDNSSSMIRCVMGFMSQGQADRKQK